MPGKRWSNKEVKILKESYNKTNKSNIMELIPNRTWKAIKNKANKEGLSMSKQELMNSSKVIKRLTNLAEKKKIKINWNEKETISYVLGVLRGDGFTNKKSTIALETIYEPFADKFIDSLNKIGMNPNKKWRKKREVFSVWGCSVDFVRWYNSIDIFDYLTNDKMKWEYLEGLYDSDGNLHPCGSPRICSYKEDVKEEVSKLLNLLDVNNSIHQNSIWIRAISSKEFLSRINSAYPHKNGKGYM